MQKILTLELLSGSSGVRVREEEQREAWPTKPSCFSEGASREPPKEPPVWEAELSTELVLAQCGRQRAPGDIENQLIINYIIN